MDLSKIKGIVSNIPKSPEQFFSRYENIIIIFGIIVFFALLFIIFKYYNQGTYDIHN